MTAGALSEIVVLFSKLFIRQNYWGGRQLQSSVLHSSNPRNVYFCDEVIFLERIQWNEVGGNVCEMMYINTWMLCSGLVQKCLTICLSKLEKG